MCRGDGRPFRYTFPIPIYKWPRGPMKSPSLILVLVPFPDTQTCPLTSTPHSAESTRVPSRHMVASTSGRGSGYRSYAERGNLGELWHCVTALILVRGGSDAGEFLTVRGGTENIAMGLIGREHQEVMKATLCCGSEPLNWSEPS